MKAQITVVVCVFSFLLKIAQAQTTFNLPFDHQQQLQFAYSIELGYDSSFYAFTPSLNIFTSEQDLLLIQFDYSGNGIVKNIVHHSGSQIYAGSSGSLFIDSDSNYVGGSSILTNLNLQSDPLVTKYDQLGDTIFSQAFEDSTFSFFYNGMEASDNNYVFVGNIGEDIYDHSDALIIKTDKDGNLIWKKNYGTSPSEPCSWIYEISGNRYIIGGIRIHDLLNQSPWLFVTDSAGNLLEDKEFSDPFYQGGGVALTLSNDSNYIMSGATIYEVLPGFNLIYNCYGLCCMNRTVGEEGVKNNRIEV